MTMVKRDDISEQQIAAAKVMPNATADEDDDRSTPDSDIVTAAEGPVQGRPGLPADKPGYRK